MKQYFVLFCGVGMGVGVGLILSAFICRKEIRKLQRAAIRRGKASIVEGKFGWKGSNGKV